MCNLLSSSSSIQASSNSPTKKPVSPVQKPVPPPRRPGGGALLAMPRDVSSLLYGTLSRQYIAAAVRHETHL